VVKPDARTRPESGYRPVRYRQGARISLTRGRNVSGRGDLAEQFATDFAGDPYYQELTTTIGDLEPDQQMSLVALMWVGRGDYALEEWDEALKFAEENWTDHTADYLVGTYLAEGLQQFETESEE
jgi:hypothetical protein